MEGSIKEVFLTRVRDEVEFGMLEELLRQEGIPVVKRHHGSGEYLELYMGVSPFGIDVFVPEDALGKARELMEWPAERADAQTPTYEELTEAQDYLEDVRLRMNRKKKFIAVLMLMSIGPGVVWMVYSAVMALLSSF